MSTTPRARTPLIATAAVALMIISPAYGAEKAAPAPAAPAAAEPADPAAAEPAAEAAPAEGAAAPAEGEAAAAPAEGQPAEAATGAAEAPAGEQPAAAEAPAEAASNISSKDLVIGTPVLASDGVKIGEINRVTSDASGKVSEIHVTAGGPAGLNAKVVSIPANMITAVGKPVKVSISGADAKKLPILDGGNG